MTLLALRMRYHACSEFLMMEGQPDSHFLDSDIRVGRGENRVMLHISGFFLKVNLLRVTPTEGFHSLDLPIRTLC